MTKEQERELIEAGEAWSRARRDYQEIKQRCSQMHRAWVESQDERLAAEKALYALRDRVFQLLDDGVEEP